MLNVTSEVGRLRRVMVHDPGPEVDLMVPSMMEELLFDDILFGDRAREEHGRFRRLLQLLGVEVLEARSLLEETLEVAEARSWLAEILLPDLTEDVSTMFAELDAEALAEALVTGRRQHAPMGHAPSELYSISPLANWCFQRDPQVVLGDGVVFGAMATPARWREAVLARAIFQWHPDLAGSPVLLDPLKPDIARPLLLGLHRPRLEGGDVLVLSPDMVAMGLSERTNSVSVPLMVSALARKEGGPRWLYVIHLPPRRAYMHLDTVFTPVDRDAALAFAPVVGEEGPERAQVFEVDLHADNPRPRAVGALLPALKARGLDLELVPCGGEDPVSQQREQWTDGANAFAVAPGVVCLYDRNVHTAEALEQRGFRIVEADDVLLGREELDIEDAGRTCILLESHEIARARGGPHCLTHPLVRDDP